MSLALTLISFTVIGFSLGFVATYYLMVKPLEARNKKLRESAVQGIMNQINLIASLVHSRNGEEPVPSPISDLFKKQ